MDMDLERSPSFKYCNLGMWVSFIRSVVTKFGNNNQAQTNFKLFFFTRMLINAIGLQNEVSHHVCKKGRGGGGRSTNLEIIYVHEQKYLGRIFSSCFRFELAEVMITAHGICNSLLKSVSVYLSLAGLSPLHGVWSVVTQDSKPNTRPTELFWLQVCP